MKTKFKLGIAACMVAATWISTLAFGAADRWYTEQQLETGEHIYRANCLVCHQEGGAGTTNWKARDSEGKLPPPPLNGTAHTWHHDLSILGMTVRQGGVKLGGSMPAFENTLSEGDIAAVIAYVQSLWPEEIFSNWANAYPEDSTRGIPVSAADSDQAASNPMLAQLKTLMPPNAQFGDPEPTPIEGIFGVQVDARFFYLDKSGQFLIAGDMIDLANGENLSETRRGKVRLERMAGFANTDKVIFPATGPEKAYIDVFTDTTCPYCRKLHSEVPQLQAAGVSVRYLPFPRSGPKGQGYEQMKSVWCADDRRAEMTTAKSGANYTPGNTACADADAVGAGYTLGVEVGVQGTPAIILPDGRMLPGYRPVQNLLGELGLN